MPGSIVEKSGRFMRRWKGPVDAKAAAAAGGGSGGDDDDKSHVYTFSFLS